MNLKQIKLNGYPCSSAEFWWLVDEIVRLRARIKELEFEHDPTRMAGHELR